MTALVRRILVLIALWSALASLAACGAGDGDEADREIVVSAASSLTDAFTDLARAFEAEHEGAVVRLNFGSSSALAAQIIEGAPVAVFASANPVQMQVVVDAGLADAPRAFARNQIVVVTPAGDERIGDFLDLGAPDLRLVLARADVPVGDYARQGIGAADAVTPGFAGAVLANLASEESNVRAVLAKVELGEADAGVVYATDAAIAGSAVRVVPIPDAFAPAAVYPIATIGDASDLAEAFVAFVLSEEGQAILERYGFADAGGSGS